MRADARRNHDAVLDAGARLLAERPTASMQEIADASGVGRTTVYRHFPAREDLIAALVERVAGDVTTVTTEAVAIEGPPEEVLRRLASDLVHLGRRWRFLHHQEQQVRAPASDRAFQEWVITAQRRGELRTDLPSEWAVAAVRGLIEVAIEEADTMGADRAARLLGDTLVSLLLPPVAAAH